MPARSIVLWVPDWPIVALQEGIVAAADQPVAVMHAGAVAACSASARAQGVRRGQRRRDAQARCPRLRVIAADSARDQRAFEPLVARAEQLAPGVQIIRPGLCALRARGPARYYGGEQEAAAVLAAGLHALSIDDVRVGIADGPFTAEHAARRTAPAGVRVVPSGESASFLAPLSVAILDDTAGAPPGLADLLGRLGVHTLGAFAQMDPQRVADRFGPPGARLHALAAGRDSADVAPRTPPPELQREVAFEPPLEIVDQVAFAVRTTAEDFLAGLAAQRLVCTELRVVLDAVDGPGSDRVWLHPSAFDTAGVVDRVRWQLEASAGDGLRGGIRRVRLWPEAVDHSSHHQPGIFGAGPEERVHHTMSRVQAMLGHRGVLTPAIGGGRWLAERQVLVPWGDRTVLDRSRSLPWPGSLPAPHPATVFPEPRPIEVAGTDGRRATIDDRGALRVPPAVLIEDDARREITAWAGPWPVVERGWDLVRSRRAYRFQLVDAEQVAWLAICEEDGWHLEARYD